MRVAQVLRLLDAHRHLPRATEVPEALAGSYLRDLAHDQHGICVDGGSELEKFDDVEPALAGLNFRDIGLVPPKALCDISLLETGNVARQHEELPEPRIGR